MSEHVDVLAVLDGNPRMGELGGQLRESALAIASAAVVAQSLRQSGKPFEQAEVDRQLVVARFDALLGETRDAVAELIAADVEYDDALSAFNNTAATRPDWPAFHERFESAKIRRAAAIARCKGESA